MNNAVVTSEAVFNREIKKAKVRSGHSVGTYVCKQGVSTGYGCGTIVDNSVLPSFVPNAKATFVRVLRNKDTAFTLGGDSGGPVFVSDTAYGVLSGGSLHSMVYMPIHYIGDLGLSVLTD